ncbi:MAG TPA: hypothetical protein VGJ13_04845 [Pseudonocardiaceae bacterium]|jgi:hypothetical protein
MLGIDIVGTAIGALFFYFLHKMAKGHGGRLPGGRILRTVLAGFSGVFLAFSIVGWALLWGLGMIDPIIPGVLLLAAVGTIILDVIVDGKVDKPALVAIVALPVLFLGAHGTFAAHGANVVTEVHNSTESKISSWLSG